MWKIGFKTRMKKNLKAQFDIIILSKHLTKRSKVNCLLACLRNRTLDDNTCRYLGLICIAHKRKIDSSIDLASSGEFKFLLLGF